MSRETTFERDLDARLDRPVLSAAFTALCEQVAGDLQRKGYAGRTISIKLRFENFQTVTRDCSLNEPTADAVRIRRAARECLRRVQLVKKIRLLGVKVSTLCAASSTSAVGACRQRELPLIP